MKYIIDTEFIDTPSCSIVMSLAILREDGAARYFEFWYPATEVTPWLAEHVVPHLKGPQSWVMPSRAAEDIVGFIGDDQPEFWCYYGAYDWYWFCRLWGGFMTMPQKWPHLFREFAYIQQGVPNVSGAEHNALNDCRSILEAMRLKSMV